jgi:uncharacterized protein YlbG (UPF0298 family)
MVYESQEEMDAVLGRMEENSFIKQVREGTEKFIARVGKVRWEK